MTLAAGILAEGVGIIAAVSPTVTGQSLSQHTKTSSGQPISSPTTYHSSQLKSKTTFLLLKLIYKMISMP